MWPVVLIGGFTVYNVPSVAQAVESIFSSWMTGCLCLSCAREQKHVISFECGTSMRHGSKCGLSRGPFPNRILLFL